MACPALPLCQPLASSEKCLGSHTPTSSGSVLQISALSSDLGRPRLKTQAELDRGSLSYGGVGSPESSLQKWLAWFGAPVGPSRTWMENLLLYQSLAHFLEMIFLTPTAPMGKLRQKRRNDLLEIITQSLTFGLGIPRCAFLHT